METTETTETTTAQASTEDEKTDLDQMAKKRLPAPVKDKGKSSAKFPAHKREKTSPSGLGLRAEPSGETAESAQFADRPMDFEITPEQAEIRDRLTAIHPGIMESPNSIAENNQEPAEDDADRARERRHLEQAIRTASRISEDNNRRLDGIPRRQEDRQAKPKQPKTEELHLTEITEEEILQTVVESRLGTEENKAFTEAKRKVLTPWSENDAWRVVRRDKCPKGTIVPMRFLIRYKEDKPHARVILQGFKHKDVLESNQFTFAAPLQLAAKTMH